MAFGFFKRKGDEKRLNELWKYILPERLAKCVVLYSLKYEAISNGAARKEILKHQKKYFVRFQSIVRSNQKIHAFKELFDFFIIRSNLDEDAKNYVEETKVLLKEFWNIIK